jgi:hypothetical protein
MYVSFLQLADSSNKCITFVKVEYCTPLKIENVQYRIVVQFPKRSTPHLLDAHQRTTNTLFRLFGGSGQKASVRFGDKYISSQMTSCNVEAGN